MLSLRGEFALAVALDQFVLETGSGFRFRRRSMVTIVWYTFLCSLDESRKSMKISGNSQVRPRVSLSAPLESILVLFGFRPLALLSFDSSESATIS